MSDTPAVQKVPPQVQSSGSSPILMPLRQPYMSESFASKRVFFYKSGDAQFNGLPVVISNRTFKTFEGLLDSLSKRVPLPFGVRTITTPRGHTAVRSLDQLLHGHSYICSDKRTVKPIDLEQARRKPPPWYHARPVSNRRLTSTRQGTHSTRWNEHAGLFHTPKRLIVYRNGDPEVKHTLLLHKRNTQSFEALINLISEVMSFPVHKLYTPDGRRVDGLPALILCSGVLIAAGREPFRKGNYDVQKPFAPTWLAAKNMRRVHQLNRKKKSFMDSTKSCPFSSSSDCYLVNQTHNNFYKNAPTGSVELKTGQQLESVAEVDTTTYMGGDTQENTYMPTDEDIEKSFRVNKDGSMTVEMKVHLTLKDEETVHWTTTLSRSSVVNQMKSVLESHPDTGALLPDNILPCVDPEALTHGDVSTRESLQAVHKEVEKTRAEGSIALINSLQPLRSTLEQCKAKPKQMSVGKPNTKAETDSHENMLGSYIYKEEEQLKHEHCMVRLHPVPMPRSTLPLEPSISQMQANTHKSAEILQLQGREEEAVHYIFQQQACQKSFLPNTQLCGQGEGTCGSDKDQQELTNTVFPEFSKMVPTSSKELYSEPMPSAIYGSHPREEKSKLLDLQKSCKRPITHEIRDKKSGKQNLLKESRKSSATKKSSTAGTSKKRKPVRIILKKGHIFRTATIEHKRIDSKTNILKEIQKIRADIFSQAAVIRAMTKYYQSKVVQKLLKRGTNLASGHKSVSAMLHSNVQLKIQNTDKLLGEKKQSINQQNPARADMYQEKLKVSPASVRKNWLHTSTNKCSLKRQTSVQEEQEFQQERQQLNESTSLPILNSSSSVFNENAKPWLKKSEPVLCQKEVPSLKSKTFPHFPKICCECLGPSHALNGDLKYYVSLDSILSSRNVSLTNPEMEETSSPMTETEISTLSPEGNGFCRDCTQEKSSLPRNKILTKETLVVKFAEETKTPHSNTAEQILPRNLSLINDPWKTSEEHKLSLTENTSENNMIPNTCDQDVKQLSKYVDVEKKGLTSHTMPDSNTTTVKLSESKLSSNPEIIGNDHVKLMSFTRNPSSEKTLPSQHSIEKIPQYNTLAKASLFKNQTVEKSQIFKPEFMNSDIISGPKCAKTLLVNLQQSSDTIETSENILTLQAESSYTVKMAVRPDMIHVLDELCNSIKSLCEVTRHKQQSCLDKFNSMPDLSSHLASTFGSSSRVLLAFLTVMTLKDGLENITLHRQAKNHLICSEAFLMIKNLVEMAVIEDAEHLRVSLKALYNSASNKFMQSWRGFQELSNRFMSHNVTPECTGSRSYSASNSEEAIQELMEKLGVPDRVREELSALHTQEKCISGNHIGESKMCEFHDSVLEEDVNIYVKSVIERAINAHLEECDNLLVRSKNQIQEGTGEPEGYFCPMLTKEQSDSVVDHVNHGDISLCGFVLYGKQQREEKRGMRETERGMEELIHEGELESTDKPKENMKEKKDRATCKKSAQILKTRISEKGSVEEDYIMEALHNTEIKRETQNLRKTRKMNKGMATEKGNNSYESSNSEERLTPSEEEKSSLEEEESCDEECMSFSEYQISDKEERLQTTVTATVSGVDQKKSIQELLDKLKHEELLTQAVDSNTGCLKKDTGPTEMHTALLAIHTQSQMKDDKKQELKSICSDEEQVVLEVPECHTFYQQHIVDTNQYSPIEEALCEENALHFSKRKNNTVANLICNLESAAQKTNNKNGRHKNTFMPHTEMSDTDSSIRTRSHMVCTSELPSSSSLAFSYDSHSSSLAQEPERMIEVNKVKSVREMFLAKSSARTQNGQRLHSPNSDQSDYQSECINSGENWSQTSPETTTVDDDSSRLAITKGFVKRTIERLYGRGNLNSTGPDDMRPQSASNGKQKEFPGRTSVSTLASFHEARTQVMADLSYFSATSSVDVYNEPANCITLNEQLEHGDADHIDKNKTILMDLQKNTLIDDCPHRSTPSPDSSGTKCTYFNLPNASDSELEQVQQKVKTLKKMDVKVTSETQSTKSWIERKSFLPAFHPPVFMKADNKVHPLTEATAPPVVTQPVSEQSAQIGVIRHSSEPDALEMVFVFCGQHCPIL